MDVWQSAAVWTTSLLSLITLAGLTVRHRLHRSYLVSAYLLVVAGQGLRLGLGHDDGLWSGWLWVELLLRVLCVGIGLELALRLFRELPEAARHARGWILGVVLFTAVLLFVELPMPVHPAFNSWPSGEAAAFTAAQRLHPRLAYGSVWLLTALYAVATTFALPLDPLHRLVLLGLSTYLMVYAVTLAALPAVEVYARAVSVMQTASFVALLGVWAYGAWRHEKPPADAPGDVVRRIWPWF